MRYLKIKILALLPLFLILSCTGREEKYVDWLYAYMPLPDRLQYDRPYWEENVRKTLEVREQMAWEIPEREFRHFVLPLRVNNETLDDFRTLYADTLCARVKDMSLADAALEINHWCHEQATYQPSDARTGSPEEVMLRGVGRCGEESVLAVAALRAAGIPARQVYTPRWAHTDDNHAWVEVWTGDGWHFMGACEPEATLDRGWFNSAVSRAMILHQGVRRLPRPRRRDPADTLLYGNQRGTRLCTGPPYRRHRAGRREARRRGTGEFPHLQLRRIL